MKAFKILLCSGCLFLSVNVFGQTPKSIEADLVKSFKRIEFWFLNEKENNDNIIAIVDSLENANDVFAAKLKIYTGKYKFTISEPFDKLNVKIVSSADGLFRIYSWDTQMGGTMHDFRNVIQYKTRNRVKSILQLDNSSNTDKNYVYYFSNIYVLTIKSKTYYLGVYNGIFSTKDVEEGIKIFSVKNGKLNDAVKLIKTKTGLHNKLSYYYDFFSSPDDKHDGDIRYDSTSKIIRLPSVDTKGKVTKTFIRYQFTGQYFERVK